MSAFRRALETVGSEHPDLSIGKSAGFELTDRTRLPMLKLIGTPGTR